MTHTHTTHVLTTPTLHVLGLPLLHGRLKLALLLEQFTLM